MRSASQSCVSQRVVSGQSLDLENVTVSCDDFISVDSLSPNGNTDKTDHHLKLDDAKGRLKLVPVDVFSSAKANTTLTLPSQDGKTCQHLKSDVARDASGQVLLDSFICMNSDTAQIISLKNDGTTVQTEGQGSGALCYEPPCFPSLDSPFGSCDLIASGGAMQNAHSPIGIRQLLISSRNFAKPCGLSNPQNLDNTSDPKFKNASKSFTHSPSNIESPPHKFSSPFEEVKGEKNHTRGANLGLLCTSRLTDKSSVDAIFYENGACVTTSSTGVSTYIKAILDHAFEKGIEGIGNKNANCPEYDVNIPKLHHTDEEESAVIDTKETLAEPTLQIQPGVLVERNRNDQLIFSPNGDIYQTSRVMIPETKRTRNDYLRSLGGSLESSPSNQRCSVVFSPSNWKKYEEANSSGCTSTMCNVFGR